MSSHSVYDEFRQIGTDSGQHHYSGEWDRCGEEIEDFYSSGKFSVL